MISVCCCSLNAKRDTEIFIKALYAHNPDVEFEVIVAHDDRVNDGSGELFKKLEKQYKTLKIVTHTKQQTVDYMREALDYYARKGLFNPSLRKEMRSNLNKYESNQWIKPEKEILWQSSGILYNKAVKEASGDIIIVTPGDFMYLFSLAELENYVKKRSRNGFFYASPPAIWARVTNMDPEWLEKHVNDVHHNGGHSPFRYDSVEVIRDYMRDTTNLSNIYVPDFRNNKLISLEDHRCIKHLKKFCTDSGHKKGIKMNPGFHGFHIMTKKTFRKIGGFTEEWIHRAFPDDKMTTHGKQFAVEDCPFHFAVAWCGQAELLPCHGPGYKNGWQKDLPKIDPWHDKHPIPPTVRRRYLYSGHVGHGYITSLITAMFDKKAPAIRIAT